MIFPHLSCENSLQVHNVRSVDTSTWSATYPYTFQPSATLFSELGLSGSQLSVQSVSWKQNSYSCFVNDRSEGEGKMASTSRHSKA